MTGQEITEYENETAGEMPVTLPARGMIPLSGGNSGAIAIESERAIAEAQGQLLLAKRFPRDMESAYEQLMKSCKLPALANVAFYKVPRGGSNAIGASIRLAEEIARCVGNIEYGHRELSRNHEKTEVEVYAWDKETNTRSVRQITVMHIRDTRNGPKRLTSQTEIDELIANKASKSMRGRILAIVPKWLKEAAEEECRKTIAGTNDVPLDERVRKMIGVFAPHGVTVEKLKAYLGHDLKEITPDEIVDLTAVYTAIRDGSKPSEYFGTAGETEEQASTAAEIMATATAAQPGQTPAAQPEAEKKPAQQEQTPPAQEVKPETAKATTAKPTTGPFPTKQKPAAAPAPAAKSAPAGGSFF